MHDEADNRLFQQFETLKLEDFSADNLDSFRDQVYIEQSNSELVNDLIRYGVINNQISFSGPLSRTQQIIQVTQTSDVGAYDIFKPNPGEVWICNGGDLLTSGGTGKVNFSLTNGSEYAYIGSSSVSGQEPITTDNLDGVIGNLFITSDVWLVGDATTFPTSTRVTMVFIRVR
jgi:hypothetical protein